MNFDEAHKRLMKDPKFKKAWDLLDKRQEQAKNQSRGLDGKFCKLGGIKDQAKDFVESQKCLNPHCGYRNIDWDKIERHLALYLQIITDYPEIVAHSIVEIVKKNL